MLRLINAEKFAVSAKIKYTSTMKKLLIIATIACGSLFLTGCDSTTSTLGGGALGTAAGAGIGYAIDGGAGGAIAGGIIGGLTGGAIGHHVGDD